MEDIINKIVKLWIESGKTSEDFLWEWQKIHSAIYSLELSRKGALEV